LIDKLQDKVDHLQSLAESASGANSADQLRQQEILECLMRIERLIVEFLRKGW